MPYLQDYTEHSIAIQAFFQLCTGKKITATMEAYIFHSIPPNILFILQTVYSSVSMISMENILKSKSNLKS